MFLIAKKRVPSRISPDLAILTYTFHFASSRKSEMIRLQVQSRADSGTRYWCFLLANDWETLSKSTGKGFTTKKQQNMISGAIGSRIDKVRLGKSTGDFRTKRTSEDPPKTLGKSAYGRPLPAGPSSKFRETPHSVPLRSEASCLKLEYTHLQISFLAILERRMVVTYGMVP